ncbi:MAG TPA: hypothetical protein VFH08_13270, partial [Chitinophagaceae bacterium]|nr:hypothetical protein [Chitinophagaceae bacterium]
MKKKLLLLITAVLLFSDITIAQKPLYTAPFGVQTYSFRRSIGKDPAKVLDTIRMMGITEIEGGGGGGLSLEEFKKLCDDRGISIPSTGAGY